MVSHRPFNFSVNARVDSFLGLWALIVRWIFNFTFLSVIRAPKWILWLFRSKFALAKLAFHATIDVLLACLLSVKILFLFTLSAIGVLANIFEMIQLHIIEKSKFNLSHVLSLDDLHLFQRQKSLIFCVLWIYSHAIVARFLFWILGVENLFERENELLHLSPRVISVSQLNRVKKVANTTQS